jgi:Domain of unknown function (DUF1788)
MSDPLSPRLNEIIKIVASDAFLNNSGIGNEIGFYIFDYPPEAELRVRDHIRFLLGHLPMKRPGLRVNHLNLFDLLLDYLKSRKLLDRALAMQRQKGDQALHKALAGPLNENRLREAFAASARPQANDLVLVSGVGSVYPMVRLHTLLNNLHPIMGSTPLVVFYPGRYDGQSLRLFGRLKSHNYYRAFRLVP